MNRRQIHAVKFYRSPSDDIRARAAFETRRWGRRTTMEGVPNLMAARTVSNRVFWTFALVATTAAGLWHLSMSVVNYLGSGVSSMMFIDAAAVEFPGVTICSLKPASESLLKYYGSVVHRHLERHWDYFDNWFLHERRQGIGESKLAYFNRVKRVFFQMLEVLWISDDTRDLSLLDRTTILECVFNGVRCGHENFTLVQHYQYWNCYMFKPNSDLRFDNPAGENAAGLTMSIFTDSNFFNSSYQLSTVHSNPQTSPDYRVNGTSLRQFLTEDDGEFYLNRVLDVNDFQADGFKVILHKWDSYPMFNQPRFTVQTSKAATLQVLSVEQSRLNRPESPCTDQSPGTIDYVVSFGSEPTDITWNTFTKGGEDLIHLNLQEEIFRHCFCYSHRIPFRVDKTKLCYYCPPSHRKAPTRDMLTRIYCHDVWMRKAADSEHLLGASPVHSETPCRRVYREVQSRSTSWPSEEDLVHATVLYFLDTLANGTDFLPQGPGPNNHRIFNFSDSQVEATVAQAGRQIVSREIVAIQSLLQPHCASMHSFHEDNIAAAANCLNTEVVRRNVMKVNVRLASPAAIVYKDSFTYDLMELLSEIGCVLGLWCGFSVLTLFEFIELIYLTFVARQRLVVRKSDSLSSVTDAAGQLH